MSRRNSPTPPLSSGTPRGSISDRCVSICFDVKFTTHSTTRPMTLLPSKFGVSFASDVFVPRSRPKSIIRLWVEYNPWFQTD